MYVLNLLFCDYVFRRTMCVIFIRIYYYIMRLPIYLVIVQVRAAQ